MFNATHPSDPQTSFKTVYDGEIFNNLSLDSPLTHKNKIVGRFTAIPGRERRFIVKPIASLPLRVTELGAYLETQYERFDLIIFEEGEIRFTLDLNGSLGIVLASIGWAYSKLLEWSK